MDSPSDFTATKYVLHCVIWRFLLRILWSIHNCCVIDVPWNWCLCVRLQCSIFIRFGLCFLIMATLWNRAGHYIFMLWFLSSIYLSFFSSPDLSDRTLEGWLPYFDTWCGPSANLECRSETCCVQLAENAGPKKIAKNWPSGHHLTTLSGYIFATKARIDNGKKLVKQQYLLHMSSQYGELQPTCGWGRSGSLGHPYKFQRVSRLGSVTARHCISGRLPNFAALNRGRHLYSTGWPSRWALAHISS